MRNLCILAVTALLAVAFAGRVAAGPHDNAVWVWEDTFDTYPTGNLGDSSEGVWGGGAEFQVISGGCPQNSVRCVETTGATSAKYPTHNFLMSWEPAGGTVFYHCRIRSPRGQSGGAGYTFRISLRDRYYVDIAYWDISERMVIPKTGDGSSVGTATQLVAGAWHELDIVHDVFTKQTDWYVDGVLKHSFNLRDLANKDNITDATIKWLMLHNNATNPTYKLHIDDVKVGAKIRRNIPEVTMPTHTCSVGTNETFVYSPFDCVTEVPTVHWKVDPHKGYEARVFDHYTSDPNDGDWYQQIKQPNVTTQHYTADYGAQLVESHVYYVFIRVKIDGVWQPWSPAGRDFCYSSVGDPRPEAPIISSPADGSWVRPLHVPPTLEWTVPGAIPHNQARIAVGTYAGEDDYWDTDWLIVPDTVNLNTLDPRPRNMVEGRVYYPRVRVRNGCEGCDEPATWCDGDGPYSSTSHRFKATNLPLVSELSPAGGITVASTTPTITWPMDVGVVAPVDQAQVRVNTDADATPANGADIKYDATFAVSGDPGCHTVATPLPTSTHLWAFVRLHNSAGWGPWSPSLDFINWPGPVDNGGFYVDTGVAGLAPVTNFTATPADGQNELSWHNPSDPGFTAAMIRCKTTGYPTSPTDGTLVVDEPGSAGTDDAYTHTSLTNGTTYYYSAFAHDSVPNYSTKAYAKAAPSPPDATPPALVDSLQAEPGDEQVTLSWHNPVDPDFTGTMIRYNTTGYPVNATDGDLVIDKSALPNTNDSCVHTGLTNGTTHYYAAFSHDGTPNYASRAIANARPDGTPPGPVTDFDAVGGPAQVTLSWRNSVDTDFVGTMIRYGTVDYPSSPTDGSLLIDKSGARNAFDSCVHTGLTPGVIYYYTAFAHDVIPNYATGVNASAEPTSSVLAPTLSVKPAGSITIDGNPADWNLSDFTSKVRGGEAVEGDYAIVGYDGATLYYAGYWTDGVLPTSASDHTATVYARADATYQYFLVRCDDTDMRYSDPVGSNWANDCVEFYIDPGHNHGSSPMSSSTSDIQLVIDANNQKNVYMCDSSYASEVLAGVTSAVVRDDGTGWWLEARITKTALDPDIPADSFGVEFNFRDNDNDNDPAQTTVYSWSDDSQISGFPTKIPDKWGDAVLGDADAPGPVTSFNATRGDELVRLTWHNPIDADFTGTMIRYSTSSYPTSPTDGALAIDKPNSPDTSDMWYHYGLVNGNTYYYSAFAHDDGPNYSAAAQASATPSDTVPPGSVSGFSVVVGNEMNNLSWTNPSDSDYAGTKILCKTTGYPADPTDGTVVYDAGGTSCTHTGLSNGTTYYYAAFAHDEVPNYSSSAQASGEPTYFGPAQAKLCADATEVTMTVGTVSAVFGDAFYVQCSEAACGVSGIKVVKSGHGASVGDVVAGIEGTVLTDPANLERYIAAAHVVTSASDVVAPRGATNTGLGGPDWNYSPATGAGQKGITDGTGLNNIGLLVRVWGRVTQRDTAGLQYFYIDDGSGLRDGTQTASVDNVGIRIIADPTPYAEGSYVTITGVSSCFEDGSGNLQRKVLPLP